MSEFAKVEMGFVVQVIVASQDVIDSGLFGGGWVECFNTIEGRNQATIGCTYDDVLNEFGLPVSEESEEYYNTEESVNEQSRI